MLAAAQALLPFTAAGQDDDAHPWGTSQDTTAADGSAGPASAASDPVRQLSYLLLLLNASVSLPCIAALQYSLHEQQEQQLKIEKHRKDPYGVQPDAQQPKDQAQGQPQAQHQQQQAAGQQDMFCGFGFSGHPEQHQQLQQMVMEAGIKAGQLLAVSGWLDKPLGPPMLFAHNVQAFVAVHVSSIPNVDMAPRANSCLSTSNNVSVCVETCCHLLDQLLDGDLLEPVPVLLCTSCRTTCIICLVIPVAPGCSSSCTLAPV